MSGAGTTPHAASVAAAPVLLAAQRPRVRYLLRDRFPADAPAPLASPRPCAPGPGTLTIADAEGVITTRGGRLRGLVQATAVWGEAELRGPAIARAAGRALVAVVYPEDVGSDLALGWSPAAVAGDPRTSGHGWLVEDGALQAIAPGVTVTIDAGSTTAKPLRPGQFLVAVVLRAAGAYVLLSQWHAGDALGATGPLTIPAYPEALLLWVDPADTTATLYPYVSGFDAGAGGSGYPGGHAIEDVRVVDVGGAWAQRFGIALAGDDFDRADNASALGTADMGGAWTVDAGTYGLSGGQARLEAGGGYSVAWLPGSADGVLQCDVAMPASGTPVFGLALRRVDSANYLRLTNRGMANSLALAKVVGGVATDLIASTVTLAAGQTYRLTLVAKGNRYGCWVNGAQIWGGWYTDTQNNHLTGSGWGLLHAGIASRVTFDRFSFHPLTVRLPAIVGRGRVPDVRTAGALLASDSFTDAAGTALAAHAAEQGGAWTEHSGSWTVDASGRAAVALGAGNYAIATQELGVSDVEASVTVVQHATFPSGTSLAGIVARCTDNATFLLVRVFMDAAQPGADEVEAMEVIGGVATIVHKVNLGDYWQAGGANTLTVRCVGDRVFVLLDGRPLLCFIPSQAFAGTRFGLGRNTGDNGCTFDDWQVRAV